MARWRAIGCHLGLLARRARGREAATLDYAPPSVLATGRSRAPSLAVPGERDVAFGSEPRSALSSPPDTARHGCRARWTREPYLDLPLPRFPRPTKM